MLPAIAPGDWLLVDPTVGRWPRRGTVVLVRQPDDGGLSIKRIAGGPGDMVPFAEGYLHLADDEAWLLADATDDETAAAGFGPPIDSHRFGPVVVDDLLGRVWFRYGPPGRPIGRIAATPHDVPDVAQPAGAVPGDAPGSGEPPGPP